MNRWAKVFSWAMVALLIFLLGKGIQTANADPKDHPDGGDLIGGSNSIGDQLIGGDSARALGLGFSYALGNVDLNEGKNCYVSTASGNIIFGRQKVELNPWCASLFYDANRKFEFAAKLRCGIPDIGDKYDSNPECVADQTLAPLEIIKPDVIETIVAKYEADAHQHGLALDAIQQELDEQQQAYDSFVSQPVQQSAPVEPYWTDERRAKLMAIVGEE